MMYIILVLFILSFLDGLLGYNQVLVVDRDKLKTTFLTKRVSFTYNRMPIGLINVGDTFQRDMDITFKGLMNRSVVSYVDDVTIYSKKRFEDLHHLKKILRDARNMGFA